jgi:hypothetical protein
MSRSRRIAVSWVVLLGAMMATLLLQIAVGQTGPQGASWEEIAELPDWGGLWEVTFAPGLNNEPPQPTPEYAAMLARYQAAQADGEIADSPQANCVPNGMPGIMTQPYPIEILFTPGKVTILIEAYAQWRQIFTDGRPHPDDPDLTFNGHSIGHWENGTLVVIALASQPTPRSARALECATASSSGSWNECTSWTMERSRLKPRCTIR